MSSVHWVSVHRITISQGYNTILLSAQSRSRGFDTAAAKTTIDHSVGCEDARSKLSLANNALHGANTIRAQSKLRLSSGEKEPANAANVMESHHKRCLIPDRLYPGSDS